MTDNTERANFEAWMKTRPGYPFAGKFANLMWAAWQARAALSAAPDAQATVKDSLTVDAQREQDQLDAKRYRWLRDSRSQAHAGVCFFNDGFQTCSSEVMLDSRIDAAIAQAKDPK